MGTMIQRYQLDEAGYRGSRFAFGTPEGDLYPNDLKGNNDLLSLSRPEIILEIHRQYLAAGADIIETNTFSSTSIAMADYKMEALVYELNFASAKLAKQATAEFNALTPDKPRFVAGALGPTNRTASISPDVNDPGYRAVSFDDLVVAYTEQVRGLIDGGVDILLIETIFDTLNAKAAIFAIDEYLHNNGLELPLMISVTITDASGRTLSGQTPEAFWNSIAHAPNLLSVGINCALGAKDMRPYLQTLANIAPVYISCYPNAGLPNAFGGYDETPEEMAAVLGEYAGSKFLNLVGGCCGTTPDHIRAIANQVAQHKPRLKPITAPVV